MPDYAFQDLVDDKELTNAVGHMSEQLLKLVQLSMTSVTMWCEITTFDSAHVS